MNPKMGNRRDADEGRVDEGGPRKPSFCVEGKLRRGGDGVLRRISARGQTGRYIRTAGGGGVLRRPTLGKEVGGPVPEEGSNVNNVNWICKTNEVKDRCGQGPLTARSMSYSVLVCAAKVRIFCVTAMAFRQLYEKKRAKRGGSSGVI